MTFVMMMMMMMMTMMMMTAMVAWAVAVFPHFFGVVPHETSVLSRRRA
jgi:hypothetical protein